MSRILHREWRLRVFQQLHQDDVTESYRASGRMYCNLCGLQYREHYGDVTHPGYNGEASDNRLCDGRIVHL
jgi:hypothetical protein